MFDRKLDLPLKVDIYIFFILTLISFLGALSKYLFIKEPFIESSDLRMLRLSTFFASVIVVPFLEEFLFRGYLCFNESKLYLLLNGLLYCLAIFAFINNKYVKILLILLVILLIIYLYFSKLGSSDLNLFIRKNLFIFVSISSILFGIVHLGNYSSFQWVNMFVIIPKILAGFFFSYLTLKYNIWVSWIFHCANNLLPFFITYVYYLFRF